MPNGTVETPVAEVPTVKPGIKTTEFWFMFALTGLSAWQATKPDNPWAQIAGQFATVAPGIYYTWSRARAKRKA